MNRHLVSLVLFGLASGLAGCSPIDLMARNAAPYFSAWDDQPHRLDAIAPGVYAWESGIERGLVLQTDDGLVVVDPFSEETATELSTALAETFPGVGVTHLLYSHHHLDHTRGGAALAPAEVWAHENTAWHFARYGKGEVLPPTRYLPAGDQTITLGGTTIQLLDFENAHAGHLWGFYLPDSDVLYGPDLAFCRTLPPFGFPDWNYAGLVEALERAESLGAGTYVPSHFDRGEPGCIAEYRGLIVDGREAALRAFDTHGMPRNEAAWFASVLKDIEADLEPDYQDWHGWDEMRIPFLTRNLSGTYLGF